LPAIDGVIHPVQAPQKGGLAAARRADHRDDLVLADIQAHVLDRVLVAVPDVDVATGHARIRMRDFANGHAVFPADFRLRDCCIRFTHKTHLPNWQV
jgi:hypothetical protein